MVCIHEIDVEPIIDALLDADDVRPVLVTLDDCSRSAVRRDALSHVADCVLYNELDGPEIGFYGEIISVLEAGFEDVPEKKPAPTDVRMEPLYFTVEMIAIEWNLKRDTIRRLFENEPGVLVIQSPPKRYKRRYRTLRIPPHVKNRVEERLSING